MINIPLYQFLCTCNTEFEKIRKFSESGNPAPCPSCHKLANRIISLPSALGRGTQKKDQMRLGDFSDNNDWVSS